PVSPTGVAHRPAALPPRGSVGSPAPLPDGDPTIAVTHGKHISYPRPVRAGPRTGGAPPRWVNAPRRGGSSPEPRSARCAGVPSFGFGTESAGSCPPPQSAAPTAAP